MKHPRRKKRKMRVIHLWNYPDALRAVSYLNHVLTSLREQWLETQRHRLDVKRLSLQKPDRATLVRLEEAQKDLDRSEDSFKETLHELRVIDVFLLNPLHGIAFLPFQKGEELAWMVFDLFAKENLAGWRLHQDPMESRRPIEEIAASEPTPPMAAAGS